MVQTLTKKDILEICELVAKILKEDFPEYSPKVSSIYGEKYFSPKNFRKFMQKKTNHVFGVKDNGNIIAVASIKGDFGGTAYIELLVVKKEYRAKGVGISLLKAVEKWALKHYYHFIWLFTESQKNIAYYKRRGFNYVGLFQKSAFGNDEYIMSKNLRDEPFPEVFSNYSKYF